MLEITSAPGDYIGGGRHYFYTPASARFNAWGQWGSGGAAQGRKQYVVIQVYPNAGGDLWDIEISAPPNQPLTPGTYPAQTDTVYLPGIAGVAVTGNYHACDRMTGTLVVSEVSVDTSGTPLHLVARFEQRCEITGPPLTGVVRYHA